MKKLTKQQLIEAALKGFNNHPAIALKKSMDKENASINNSAVKEIMTKADLFNKLESEKEIKPISLTGENEDYYGMEDIKYDNEPSKEWKEKRKKDLADSSEQIIKNAETRKEVRDNRPMYAKDQQPITNVKQKSQKSLAFESLIRKEDKVEGNVFIVENDDVKAYIRWENNAPLVLFEQDKSLAEKQKEMFFKLTNYEIGQKNKVSRKLNKNEETFLFESLNKVRDIVKNAELRKTETLIKEAEEKGDSIVEATNSGVGIVNTGMHYDLTKYIVKKLINKETIKVNQIIFGSTETFSDPNYEIKKYNNAISSLEERFKGAVIEEGEIYGIYGGIYFVSPETANDTNPTIIAKAAIDENGNLIEQKNLNQPAKIRTPLTGEIGSKLKGSIFASLNKKDSVKEFYEDIKSYGVDNGFSEENIDKILSDNQVRTDITTFYFIYKNIIDGDLPVAGNISKLLQGINIVLGKGKGKITDPDAKILNPNLIDILKGIDNGEITTPEELFNKNLTLTNVKKSLEKTSNDIMNVPSSDELVIRYVKSDRDKKVLSLGELKFINKQLTGLDALKSYSKITNKKSEIAKEKAETLSIVDKNGTIRKVQTRDFFNGFLSKDTGKTYSIVLKNVKGYEGNKIEKLPFSRSPMSIDSGKIKYAELDDKIFNAETFKK